MNQRLHAYLMDHLPVQVLQEPPWTAFVAGYLTAAPVLWPIYVTWRNPFEIAGVAEWADAFDLAAVNLGELILVQSIIQQGIGEDDLPLGRPEQVDGCPVIRLGARPAPAEERAVRLAKRRFAAG